MAPINDAINNALQDVATSHYPNTGVDNDIDAYQGYYDVKLYINTHLAQTWERNVNAQNGQDSLLQNNLPLV